MMMPGKGGQMPMMPAMPMGMNPMMPRGPKRMLRGLCCVRRDPSCQDAAADAGQHDASRLRGCQTLSEPWHSSKASKTRSPGRRQRASAAWTWASSDVFGSHGAMKPLAAQERCRPGQCFANRTGADGFVMCCFQPAVLRKVSAKSMETKCSFMLLARVFAVQGEGNRYALV